MSPALHNKAYLRTNMRHGGLHWICGTTCITKYVSAKRSWNGWIIYLRVLKRKFHGPERSFVLAEIVLRWCSYVVTNNMPFLRGNILIKSIYLQEVNMYYSRGY